MKVHKEAPDTIKEELSRVYVAQLSTTLLLSSLFASLSSLLSATGSFDSLDDISPGTMTLFDRMISFPGKYHRMQVTNLM